MTAKWIRVSKSFRCPQCKRPDWCSVCPELNLVLCMRITSDRPSKNAMGGYLHRLDAEAKPPVHIAPAPPAPLIDAEGMIRQWEEETDPTRLYDFAGSLGVTYDSLRNLQCCRSRSHHAWAFPMKDGSGKTIGIRLRYDDGAKRAVRGSRSGLFIPITPAQSMCWLAEGPTDCAALLSLGLFAIGRPSCSGGTHQIWMALRERLCRRAVIVADNDQDKHRPDGESYNPGIDGATRLANELDIPSCVLITPAKDVREFVRLGGTAALLQSTLNSLVWNQPRTATTTIDHQLNNMAPSVL